MIKAYNGKTIEFLINTEHFDPFNFIGKTTQVLGLFDPACFTFITKPMNLDEFYKCKDCINIYQYSNSFLLNLRLSHENAKSVEMATDLIIKVAAYSENLAGILIDNTSLEIVEIIANQWNVPLILRVTTASQERARVAELRPYIIALMAGSILPEHAPYNLHFYREFFLDLPIISEGGINTFLEARYRARLGAKGFVLDSSVSPMFYQDIYDNFPESNK